MERRVLFARVGWMRFYTGPIKGDEKPVGGGRYNVANVGGEAYNFKNVDGRLYAYFQPPWNRNIPNDAGRINLQRIDVSKISKDRLEDVLVIFVSRRPEGGQVIVGWYKNAVVYHDVQKLRSGPRHSYFSSSDIDEGVLLPEYNRSFAIPAGGGGFSQSNVCYTLENSYLDKNLPWMAQAISFVNNYQGLNILVNPEADAEQESAEAVERALARSTAQGFALDARERRAIEQRAMEKAKKHFKSQGYNVEDVSAWLPYDLLCRKGKTELHVEVKGTTTSGETIVLTRNEVDHTNSHESCALFILHSMRIEKKKAVGGVKLVRNPWKIEARHLAIINYTYRTGQKG